jgi:hypothetical protein
MPAVARPTPAHWWRRTGSTPPSHRKSREKSGTVVRSRVDAKADVRSSPSVKPSW